MPVEREGFIAVLNFGFGFMRSIHISIVDMATINQTGTTATVEVSYHERDVYGDGSVDEYDETDRYELVKIGDNWYITSMYEVADTLQSANTEAAAVRTAVQAYLAEGGTDTSDGIMGSNTGPSRNCTGFAPNTYGRTPIDYYDGMLRAEYSINTTAPCIVTAADPSGPGNWGDSIEWDYAICEWKNA